MIRKTLVLLLLLSAATASAATYRLGTDVVPVHQSVTLKMDPREDTYSGSVAIELDVRNAVPSFSLHADELTIGAAAIDGVAARVEPGPKESQAIVITPASPLQRGKAKLTIEFTNEYDRRAVGLYKMVRKDEPYLFTQFQAIDARKAFPVFDEPSFKIPFQLTATIPSQYEVVCNTPAVKQSEADGWKTVTFAPSKPLPSYLVALAVGAFEFTPVPGTKVPMRIITVKGQSALTKVAVQQTPPLLEAMETYFGIPYPFEKLDLIGVPEYWAGAMENPGLITYNESILLMDENASPGQKRSNARVTAHELAHMWFGDLVTMAWWDDLWLNESFADWMGDKIAHQVYPQYGVAMNELESVQGIMNVDASPLTNPIRKTDASPEEAMRSVGLAYNKGKAVISMFERWLGPEQFRKGVNAHLRKYSWKNATASDFWASLGKQVSAPMSTFIDQPGIPLVTVEKTGPNEVRLSQKRYLKHGVTAPAQTWQVPVALRYSDGRTTRVQRVLLDSPSRVVKLDAPNVEWVFPNADAAGYYRWQLPPADFLSLAGKSSESLSVAERIAFLGNLRSLLDAGVINGSDYLEVISRFANQTEPPVIDALMSAVLRVDEALGDADRELFAAYVRRTFAPALERIGYQKRAGEDPTVSILRPQLLAWVAVIGKEPRAVAFAKEQAAKYLADPASMDASLAGVALSAYVAEGDASMFEEMRKRFEAATVPADRSRYLGSLGSFRSKEMREKALAYALESKAIRPNELFTIPFGYMFDEEGRSFIFRWFLANYDTLVSRLPPPYRAGMPRIAGGCSEERLEEAKKFFSVEGRKVEGTDREMARTAERVKECVAFRAREAGAIRQYLQQGREAH